MKKLMVLALMLGACGDKDDTATDDTAAADDTAASEDDRVLADAQAALEGYEGWGQHADWTGIVASTDVHGDFVQIWVNEPALTTINAGASEDLPAGSLIVKRGYDDEAGAELKNLTAMYKDADYGWFWFTLNGSDELQSNYGQPDGCVNCHSSGQDMVRFVTW